MKDIVVALIGAVATIVVAIITRPSRPVGPGKLLMVKPPFRATKAFVFLLAPLIGAGTFLILYKGADAIAGPPELKAPFCIQGYFYPSGWMGDGAKGNDSVTLNDQWKDNCHSEHGCSRVTYAPGTVGWAGMYWQYPDSNWGDSPGRKIKGATKLVFWARGQQGGEQVTFKAGGITGRKYQDSFERVLRPVALTTQWERFEIDLTGADTSSVIGPFSWSASRQGNPQGLTFYLDDICFE